MESRTNRNSIRKFVDSLAPGARVIWIANGAMGTIQPDKTILWDDGHHMTHKQMNDTHALLIRSESEKQNRPRPLYPVAIVSEPEIPSVIGRRKHHLKAIRTHA
jgi:hypothetical protein